VTADAGVDVDVTSLEWVDRRFGVVVAGRVVAAVAEVVRGLAERVVEDEDDDDEATPGPELAIVDASVGVEGLKASNNVRCLRPCSASRSCCFSTSFSNLVFFIPLAVLPPLPLRFSSLSVSLPLAAFFVVVVEVVVPDFFALGVAFFRSRLGLSDGSFFVDAFFSFFAAVVVVVVVVERRFVDFFFFFPSLPSVPLPVLSLSL
jgi:hypothetical protein